MKGLRNVVAALAFVGASMAQSLSISTPARAANCEPVVISWSGGTGPYRIDIIPAGQSPAPVASLGTFSGSSTTWTVDVASGTSISLRLSDAGGAQARTSAFTIQAGTCGGGGAPPPPPPTSSSPPPPASTSPTTTNGANQPPSSTQTSSATGGAKTSSLADSVASTTDGQATKSGLAASVAGTSSLLPGGVATVTSDSGASASPSAAAASSSSNTGVIIGAVLGAVLIISIFLFLVFCLRRRRRREQQRREDNMLDAPGFGLSNSRSRYNQLDDASMTETNNLANAVTPFPPPPLAIPQSASTSHPLYPLQNSPLSGRTDEVGDAARLTTMPSYSTLRSGLSPSSAGESVPPSWGGGGYRTARDEKAELARAHQRELQRQPSQLTTITHSPQHSISQHSVAHTHTSLPYAGDSSRQEKAELARAHQVQLQNRISEVNMEVASLQGQSDTASTVWSSPSAVPTQSAPEMEALLEQMRLMKQQLTHLQALQPPPDPQQRPPSYMA